MTERYWIIHEKENFSCIATSLEAEGATDAACRFATHWKVVPGDLIFVLPASSAHKFSVGTDTEVIEVGRKKERDS